MKGPVNRKRQRADARNIRYNHKMRPKGFDVWKQMEKVDKIPTWVWIVAFLAMCVVMSSLY